MAGSGPCASPASKAKGKALRRGGGTTARCSYEGGDLRQAALRAAYPRRASQISTKEEYAPPSEPQDHFEHQRAHQDYEQLEHRRRSIKLMKNR